MNADEIELCRIYGHLSREYLGEVDWETCVDRLRQGWLRLRRDPSLQWDEAEPLIRVFWTTAR